MTRVGGLGECHATRVAPWVRRIRGETVRGDFRAIRRPLRVNLGVDV